MNDIVTSIVTIPRRFQTGDVSVFGLLKATGYFELHDEISESDIRDALLEDPRCVQEWTQYCSDKRTSTGWYIRLNDEELYEVGYFDIKAEYDTCRMQYENQVDACAAFIKREIESIRCGA
jgi:hypothetical protein